MRLFYLLCITLLSISHTSVLKKISRTFCSIALSTSLTSLLPIDTISSAALPLTQQSQASSITTQIKSPRLRVYSVEFTDPPSLVPRTTAGEESALQRLLNSDAVILGQHRADVKDAELEVSKHISNSFLEFTFRYYLYRYH